MNRLFATILAVFYLVSSTGATINLHYCMGEYVSFSLFGKKAGKCGKCGMQKHSRDNGCCKDVQIVMESNDQHLPRQIPYDFLTSLIVIHYPIYYPCNEAIITQITGPAFYVAHSPPFKDLSAFIRFHSFLI